MFGEIAVGEHKLVSAQCNEQCPCGMNSRTAATNHCASLRSAGYEPSPATTHGTEHLAEPRRSAMRESVMQHTSKVPSPSGHECRAKASASMVRELQPSSDGAGLKHLLLPHLPRSAS